MDELQKVQNERDQVKSQFDAAKLKLKDLEQNVAKLTFDLGNQRDQFTSQLDGLKRTLALVEPERDALRETVQAMRIQLEAETAKNTVLARAVQRSEADCQAATVTAAKIKDAAEMTANENALLVTAKSQAVALASARRGALATAMQALSNAQAAILPLLDDVH